jgi:hypothetical protein
MTGLLLAAGAVVSAPSAWAETPAMAIDPPSFNTPRATAPASAALFKIVFAPANTDGAAQFAPARDSISSASWADPGDAGLAYGVLLLPTYGGAGPDSARLLESSRAIDSRGVATWSSGEVMLSDSAAGVGSVRMSVGAVARAPGGLVSARPDGLFDPDAQAFDVRYIHGWPSALKWSAAGYDLDVSPHAGLGVSSAGGTAEAGAVVRFGVDMGARMARKLGLRQVDTASFGGHGRWYLFAAASGQAVGLNITGGAPGLPRSSWSTESTGALISDAQAGVGWREGDLQASFGYVHREIKAQTLDPNGSNLSKVSDSMLAFSLSIRPH